MGLPAGGCQFVCSLTPVGYTATGLPAVDLPEGLSNVIPLKNTWSILRSLCATKMTTAVGNTYTKTICDVFFFFFLFSFLFYYQ